MSENSKIEWTDHTFNPWWGCAKVGPGCENCYAEAFSHRFGWDVWGDTERRLFNDKHWKGPVKWNAKAGKAGKQARVFCGSMCDVFEDHPDLDQERLRLWDMIENTPHLTWMLLTKRPENIKWMLPVGWLANPRPNVWLGTSVENQDAADQRLPRLLEVPAVVRFVSCEPLLGPIDLKEVSYQGDVEYYLDVLSSRYSGIKHSDSANHFCHGLGNLGEIHWVIAGGESGPNARPMHPIWPKFIQDQCQSSKTPFFFKQWGEWANGPGTGKNRSAYISIDGHCVPDQDDMRPYTEYTFIHRPGKKVAGRIMSGQEWNQVPG